jgi:CRISPR-associated protein Csb2
VIALRERASEAGRMLGLSLGRAEEIARALRGALLHHAADPPPAVLSGHEPDGRLLERPHVAFLALPGPASGDETFAVAGVAIVLPRDIEEEDRQAILLAAARWERSGARLLLGRLGAMHLTRDAAADAEAALALGSLLGPSRHWASLTPVALQRNPGDLAARDPAAAARARRHAEQTVADACGHIGLPRPAEVRVTRSSPLPGVPPASLFAPYPRFGNQSRLRRVCVHVTLRFEEPVAGPVSIGAGRYFGVGVCARHDVQP